MENIKVEELKNVELMRINGGRRVSRDSSLAYDVGWWMGTAYRAMEDTVRGWFD